MAERDRSRMVIGLAAHVDAGKTTLSEAMLFLSGAVRKQGRVDHGDAFLDTEKMEKERGITIFSKQARMSWRRADMTLLDTPGHTDFSGETERAISVMDSAVLVISAAEGAQPHTLTLWKLLEQGGIPTVLFVNKMDMFQGDREELMESLRGQLSAQIADYTLPDPELIALCDETLLDAYLREGHLPEQRLRRLFAERKLFPCFFGSALRNQGIQELLDFLADSVPTRRQEEPFSARVYKVARDAQGARLTFLKVNGGILHARDLLTKRSDAGEVLWSEKAAELRLYSGAKGETVAQAEAGEIACAVGLASALPGDALGAETGQHRTSDIHPCYACRLIPEKSGDTHALLKALRALEEEEPLMRVEYLEAKREIHVQSMGEVYLEVLARQLKDRFGLSVSFGETSVLYRETIDEMVEGMGHYEPLRHYAEVHLLLTPLPPGSGIETESLVSTDELAINWQRLILTHVREVSHPGVLLGAPLTDLRVSLVAGKAHLKHTEGGDFRQATYRALRQGLMKARSQGHARILEPWVRLEAAVPENWVGRVMNDLSRMSGTPEELDPAPDGLRRFGATVPAAACMAYAREIAVQTHGRGRVQTTFAGYRPCAHPEQVMAERGYAPERDVAHPADSVFCSHGAGVTVPWAEAEQYMHLPSWTELRARRQAEQQIAPRGGETRTYHGTKEEDEALRAIFEKTYGPVKSHQLLNSARDHDAAAQREEKRAQKDIPSAAGEILIVDGYNVLFAWDEWKALREENLEAARRQLMDLLCNYAGMTGKDVLIVFDGYRVQGNTGEAERYHNLFVIYTQEAQTADAFIEKTTLLAGKKARVRVITSDQPEQLIALGHAAMRTSAREFRQEVIQVQGSIAAFLEKNNRPGAERALERAYKDAWRKKRQGEGS